MVVEWPRPTSAESPLPREAEYSQVEFMGENIVSVCPTHLQNPQIKGDGVHLKIRGHHRP